MSKREHLLPRLSVDRPVSVIMVVLALLVVGAVAYTRIPLALFPARFREILDFLPFAAVSSFPIRSLMGQVSPAEWGRGLLVMAAWMLVFGIAATLIWHGGFSHYSGCGSLLMMRCTTL